MPAEPIGVEVDAAGQLTAPGAESLAVYNLQGVAVARAAGSTLDASRLSGLHIVEAVDASGRRTVKKIVL